MVYPLKNPNCFPHQVLRPHNLHPGTRMEEDSNSFVASFCARSQRLGEPRFSPDGKTQFQWEKPTGLNGGFNGIYKE